jgi:DNA adenine methylase
LPRIRQALGSGRRLIEPFVGSGAVFLNARFDRYLLADSNPDLIGLYQHLCAEGEGFIEECAALFTLANNTARRYYLLRGKFNRTADPRRRAILFLYLNRHCYNGLIRYNAGGEFNTPFGRYMKPYFPRREMRAFLGSARRARFLQSPFRTTMLKARAGDVVYCDPPYVPLSLTARFTDYSAGGFGWNEQVRLAETAAWLARRGVRVVISNHDTPAIRALYQDHGARFRQFQVRRTISCNAGQRDKVGELLAVFDPARITLVAS